MKFFTAISLFIILLAQTFSSFLIEANFYLNRDYIAKNLCVNRDKPMMHCNGKCFLAKKLDQQEKGTAPVSRNERVDISPFFVPSTYSFTSFGSTEKPEYFTRNENAVSSFSPFIFHPPTA